MFFVREIALRLAFCAGMARAKLHFKEKIYFDGWTPMIFPNLLRIFVFRFWYSTGYWSFGNRVYMNWHLLNREMELKNDIWGDLNMWVMNIRYPR